MRRSLVTARLCGVLIVAVVATGCGARDEALDAPRTEASATVADAGQTSDFGSVVYGSGGGSPEGTAAGLKRNGREIASLEDAYGVGAPESVNGGKKLGSFEIPDGFAVIYDNGIDLLGTPIDAPVDYRAYLEREKQWAAEGAWMGDSFSRAVRVGRFDGVGSAAGFNGQGEGRTPRPAYVDWYDSDLGIRFQVYLNAEGSTLGDAIKVAQMVKRATREAE